MKFSLENVRDIVVIWSTMDKTDESIVKYSLNGSEFKAKGDSHLFVDGGKKQHRQYIHKVCVIYSLHYSNRIF